jgi:hypothetical protein
MSSKIIFKIFLLSICLGIILSNSLISLYLKKEAEIKKIISIIGESQSMWEFTDVSGYSISMSTPNGTGDGSDEYIKFSNFRFDNGTFESDQFNSTIQDDNKTLTSVSFETNSPIMKLKFNFDCNYKLVKNNNTINETNVFSWITLSTKQFNFTRKYLNYTSGENSLSFDLFLLDFKPFENQRIESLLKDHFTDSTLKGEIYSMAQGDIFRSINKYFSTLKNNKTISLITGEKNNSYTLSIKLTDNLFVPDNSSIINFLSGSILEAPQFDQEDSTFYKWTKFDHSEALGNSDFQIFIHKKIFHNLFKLDKDQKTFQVYNSDISDMKIYGLNELSINWLAQFYPTILDSRSITDKFHVEYKFTNITWDYYLTKVDFKFYFIDEVEVVLEFDMSFYFNIQTFERKLSEGNFGVNFGFTYEGSELSSCNIITKLSGKFNKQSFSKAMKDFVMAFMRKNKILRDYESFASIYEGFNRVEILKQGIVLGVASIPKVQMMEQEKGNLKFLQ